MIKIIEDLENEDLFVWRVVPNEIALMIHQHEIIDLFALHDDGSESLIDSHDDLINYINKGLDIGIEGGFLPMEQIEDYKHQLALDKASEEASELFLEKESKPFVFYRSKEDKTIFVWMDEDLEVVGLNWHHGGYADHKNFGQINDDVTRIFNKITSHNNYDFNTVLAILEAIERYEIAFNLTSYKK